MLFADGFESGSLAAWSGGSGLAVQSAVAADGTWAARGTMSGAGASAWAALPAPATEVTASTSVRISALTGTTTSVNFLKVRTATGTAIAEVYLTPSRLLGVRNDVTGVATTSTTALATDSWRRVALHVLVADTHSYDLGSWHVIALNSNCGDAGGCGAGSAQDTWLQADLAAHCATCTLAYWHIPLWSSGGRAAPNSATFTSRLYAAGADVVLAGHDHVYERFAPQNPAGQPDPARGIRAFVVGTGGANHTTITTVAANSEVRNAATFGVLRLVLHPAGYDWRFVPEAGKTFTDAGTAACH